MSATRKDPLKTAYQNFTDLVDVNLPEEYKTGFNPSIYSAPDLRELDNRGQTIGKEARKLFADPAYFAAYFADPTSVEREHLSSAFSDWAQVKFQLAQNGLVIAPKKDIREIFNKAIILETDPETINELKKLCAELMAKYNPAKRPAAAFFGSFTYGAQEEAHAAPAAKRQRQ